MIMFDPQRAPLLALTGVTTLAALYSTRKIISSISNSHQISLNAGLGSSLCWGLMAGCTSSFAYWLTNYLNWEEPKESLERLANATEKCIEGYFDISMDSNYLYLENPFERNIICRSFYLSLAAYFNYQNCLQKDQEALCHYILEKGNSFFSLSDQIHQSWQETLKLYEPLGQKCEGLYQEAASNLQAELLPGLYMKVDAHLICGYPFMAPFAKQQCSAYTELCYKQRRLQSLNKTIPKSLTNLRDRFRHFRIIHCAGLKEVLQHYNVSNFAQVYANMSSLSLKPDDKNFFQAQ